MKFIDTIHKRLFDNKALIEKEKKIVYIAIIFFIIHIITIYLANLGFKPLRVYAGSSLIEAIATPFTFILIYELYLMITSIGSNVTVSVKKQYQIVALIIIRNIFKKISELGKIENFDIANFLPIILDLLTTVIIFCLIGIFIKLTKKEKYIREKVNSKEALIKKTLTITNFLLFMSGIIFLFILEFREYPFFDFHFVKKLIEETFIYLIITDILLLLISLLTPHKFNDIIRNWGLIISSIVIRFSITSDYIYANFFVVIGIIFGVLITYINNKFYIRRSSIKNKNN